MDYKKTLPILLAVVFLTPVIYLHTSSPNLTVIGSETQVSADENKCSALFSATLKNNNENKAEQAKVYCRLVNPEGRIIVEEMAELGDVQGGQSKDFTVNLSTDCSQQNRLDIYCRSTCGNCFKIPVEIRL